MSNVEEVKIEKLVSLKKEVDFWLVSGDRVHDLFSSKWKNKNGHGEFIGGHHYIFPYIPEDEIWISDLDKERMGTSIHEYVERYLMKNSKYSYEEAHKVATDVEYIIFYKSTK